MARQDYQGAPISGVTGNVAGSTTSDSGSDFISGGDSDRNYTAAIRDSKGNITNPYPDGFFSRIFGAENVSYAGLLDQNQMAGIESMRYNRYNNPQAAVSKGFGSLFGGAEGEMTVAGPRVAQIQPATTGQNLAGLGFSLAIPGVGALSRAARTTYVPEGYLNKDFDSPSALSATSEIATGISPEAVGSMYDRAAGYVDQAKEGIRSFFTDNDVDDVIDNLSPAPADYEESVGATSDTTGMFRVGDQFVSTSKYEPEFITQGTTPQLQQELTELANDDILRGRDFTADQITPFSPSRYDNLTRREGEMYGALNEPQILLNPGYGSDRPQVRMRTR